MKHYDFGSSTAKRTDNCPAWRVLSADLPRKPMGAAAQFGTEVHEILEHIALGTVDIKDIDSLTSRGLTERHVEMVRAMWDATEAVFDQYGVEEFEPEVTGTAAEDVGGTLDMIAFAKDGSAILLDYKTGAGVQVDVENNSQILFAAWVCRENSSMAKELREVENPVGVIIQPGLSGEVQTKTWTFTAKDVDDFAVHHRLAIEKAREGGEPNTGEHCKFCPAATICPAKTDAVRRALTMSPGQLATLGEQMALTEQVLEWVTAVKERAEEQLQLGAKVPGYKLVDKRAVEKWTDEKALVKAHPELLTKLATPAQARKLGFDTDGYTVKESSGTTIAKDTDKRAAVINTAALAASINAAR